MTVESSLTEVLKEGLPLVSSHSCKKHHQRFYGDDLLKPLFVYRKTLVKDYYLCRIDTAHVIHYTVTLATH